MAAAAYQPDPEPETLSSGDLDLTQATFELHSEHQPHMSFANPLYVPVSNLHPNRKYKQGYMLALLSV